MAVELVPKVGRRGKITAVVNCLADLLPVMALFGVVWIPRAMEMTPIFSYGCSDSTKVWMKSCTGCVSLGKTSLPRWHIRSIHWRSLMMYSSVFVSTVLITWKQLVEYSLVLKRRRGLQEVEKV